MCFQWFVYRSGAVGVDQICVPNAELEIRACESHVKKVHFDFVMPILVSLAHLGAHVYIHEFILSS